MKKILAILLCAVMTLSLVACGEENKETQLDNSEKTNELVSESSGVDSDNTIVSDNNVVENDETSVDELNMSFEISGDGTHLMILEGDCLANFIGSFLWIRLYDETGNDGICMSLSPDGWNLSHIAADIIYYEHFQDEPLVTDLESSIWTIELNHDDFIQAVESCSSYEVIYKDFLNEENTRTVLKGIGCFMFNERNIENIETDEVGTDEVGAESQTDYYDLLIGSWEEDERHMVYTFYEDRTVKEWFTTDELRCSYFSEATFDGVNIKFKYSDGKYGSLGPITLNDKSFTINAGGWDGDNITFYLKNSPSNAD